MKRDRVLQEKVEEDRLIGFFANASYSYDNRYLFDFSYRTDGSSKFGKSIVMLLSGLSVWHGIFIMNIF